MSEDQEFRLIGFALGDLEAADNEEVEALIHRDQGARQVVEEVRRVAQILQTANSRKQLERTGKPSPLVTLENSSMSSISIGTTRARPFTPRQSRIRPAWVAVSAGGLAAGAMAVFAFEQNLRPIDPGDPPEVARLASPMPRDGQAEHVSPKPIASFVGGRVIPIAPALETMRLLDGRDIPLFSADGPAENQDRVHFLYPAPVRVIEEPRFDPKSHQISVTLNMTVPPAARDGAAKNLANSLAHDRLTQPQVLVQPLSFQSYSIELIVDDKEGSLRIGSAGDRTTAIVLPPDANTYSAVVPETMPLLMEKLRSAPRDVRVRLHAVYDFERVVKGSVSLARVGAAIHRILEEVRPKFPDGKVPPELYVDRQVRDHLLARLGDSIETVETNSGLSPEAFTTFVAETRQSLKEQFASLPSRDAYGLITRDANEMAFVYTAENGQIESKPITSHDKINYKEKSEEHSRKATEALKIVQDIARKGEFDRKSHQEMRDKFALDGKLSVGIGIFKGSAKLKLDTANEKVTDDDIKKMNDDRNYWTSDSQRNEEVASSVKEKFQGDMNFDKSIAKTLDLYRIDERDLTSRVEARASRTLSQGFEGLGLLTETNLAVRPADSYSFDAFAELVKKVEAVDIKVQEHQQVAFAELVKKVDAANTKVRELQNVTANLVVRGGDSERGFFQVGEDVLICWGRADLTYPGVDYHIRAFNFEFFREFQAQPTVTTGTDLTTGDNVFGVYNSTLTTSRFVGRLYDNKNGPDVQGMKDKRVAFSYVAIGKPKK